MSEMSVTQLRPLLTLENGERVQSYHPGSFGLRVNLSTDRSRIKHWFDEAPDVNDGWALDGTSQKIYVDDPSSLSHSQANQHRD